MRHLLAALLVVPALALAQIPIRPPPQDQTEPRPAPRPPMPTGPRPTTPPTTPPGAPPPGAPSPGAPSPAPTPQPPGRGGAANAGSATTVRPADAKCVPLKGRFMLQFNKADISDILEQASRWTCRNFMFTEDVARGKITLLSKTPVTAEEAYAAFLAALNSNNIAIYPTGKYYKLVRVADAKKNPIPTYTGEDGAPFSEQPVTKVIRLSYADADQLRGIMANFVSPQGADIQAIPPNVLVITDIGLNIRRIEKLIDAIDRAGAGDQVRIVQIRWAAAKDIADKINQIFQAQGGRPGARSRAMISAPRPGVTPAPGAPGAAPGAPGGGPVEVSVSKVLPDERTNKLIVIADEKSFQRIQELIDQLDVPTATAGGIHVVFLRNANAEELAQTLSNLAQGAAKRTGTTAAAGGAPSPTPVPTAMGAPATPPTPRQAAPAGEVTAELFSGEVKVTADKQQNALLIQASAADFQAMARLIAQLDRARRQVFVEAVIMEVDINDQFQFGVGAHAAPTISYQGQKALIPIASEPGNVSSLNLQSVIALGGFLTGFQGPVSADLKALGLNLPSVGILVQALQTNSDVKVLSTPHLLASDNEESEIAVGQNVPFQAGYAPSGIQNLLTPSATGASSALGTTLGLGGLNSLYAPIQRQNVELRLKLKPQINEGGNVRMTLEVQNEEIASTDPVLGPTTAKRSVKSQIVAKDQSTIVIGGLIQDRKIRSIKKIPVLGSLPVVGWLFRANQDTVQKTNLLIFLTPYIIRDENDYRRIYARKRKEQQEFIEQYYGTQPSYKVEVDFTRKAGPYSKLHGGIQEESSKIENGGKGGPGEHLVTPPGGDTTGPNAPPPPAPSPPQGGLPPSGPGFDRLEVQPEVPAPGEPAAPLPPHGEPTAPPEQPSPEPE
jgi:general secretion pathway protein D